MAKSAAAKSPKKSAGSNDLFAEAPAPRAKRSETPRNVLLDRLEASIVRRRFI